MPLANVLIMLSLCKNLTKLKKNQGRVNANWIV